MDNTLHKGLLWLFSLFPAVSVPLFPADSVAERPNIILIYVDDMGIGDAGFMGGKVVQTPNLNELARSGKFFTRYYTPAPVCSPSRVSVTTGSYHIRWGINTFLSSRKFNAGCEQENYLDTAAPSLARTLRESGYATAHFGKWHMGGGRDVDDAPSIPMYGFDEYASTYESPDPDPLLTSTNWIWAPSDTVKRWERTAYFVDRTLDFLRRHPDKPCYVNLWPDDVHTPWVSDESAEENWRKGASSLSQLRPVLADFDRQIGRLTAGLKEMGIDQNTLIILTSDNGPAPGFDRLRTNELRGVKNSLYEGGVNMPFIVSWPGRIKPGRNDHSLIASIDLFPTLCRIARVEIPQCADLDGVDCSGALLSEEDWVRPGNLYMEYGRNETFKFTHEADRSPQLALPHGTWTLLTNPDGSRLELYNLDEDPAESLNLADEQPSLARKLASEAVDWYTSTDKSALSGPSGKQDSLAH